tara:strand:+ start:7807 stop:8406 length:600 start_codon:yes stop_codon:yes gene_type:complete
MNLTLSKFTINYRFKFNKAIFILLISLCISACQNIQNSPNTLIATNTVNFGQYYLALKNLSDSELQSEIEQQRLKKSQGSIEAGINLILLYSLPNSPIHNVYSAKSQLNKQLKVHKNYYLSSADQAFISLLKDQLNQQLYLFQQMMNQELAHDTQTAKYHIKEKKQLNKIAALELTVTQLTKKIIQLKKIEQTISEHGQ